MYLCVCISFNPTLLKYSIISFCIYLCCDVCVATGVCAAEAGAAARPDMRVRRERLQQHPGAPLLLAALGFGASGRMLRVAGVSCGGKQLVTESFQQMFRCV